MLPTELSQQHQREMLAARLLAFSTANTAQSMQVLCPDAKPKMPGTHNLENILAAGAMATAFGVGRHGHLPGREHLHWCRASAGIRGDHQRRALHQQLDV